MKNKLLKVLIVDDNVSDLNGIKELIDWKDLGFALPVLLTTEKTEYGLRTKQLPTSL